MPVEFQFEQWADFSTVIGENKIVASSVGANGEAVLLTVAPEYEKVPFGHEDKGGAKFPLSKPNRSYPAVFVRYGSSGILQKTELRDIEIALPFIQPLPDGEVLVVGARCHYKNGDPEKNAFVFSREGEVLRRFVLGDGINDVQTTNDGLIWVSYFDEGVFGNYGWTRPIGAPGLVCFDSTGHIVWQFTPPAGFDFICDCYALNVTRTAVWTCYYTDFPVVKIDAEKRVLGWKNEIRGACALAADDRRVLLWGGYPKDAKRCVVQDIDHDALTNPRELVLCLPATTTAITEAKVFGRGPALHAFADNSWFVFDFGQQVR